MFYVQSPAMGVSLWADRFTTHRAVPAATPTSTAMAGWVAWQDLGGGVQKLGGPGE